MKHTNTRTIKNLLLFFIIAFFISGLTAIPIDWQLSTALNFLSPKTLLYFWLSKVLTAYEDVKIQYPFLLYGYDWLAFAHFVLAILFIGPYKDPVKNIWVIQFGLIASILVIPYAFVFGFIRGIPIGWRLIDCSFGVFGLMILYYCYKK